MRLGLGLRAVAGTTLTVIGALVTASVLLGSTTPPAVADTVDGGGGGYAAWTLAGSGNAYSGSVRLPGGFPTAAFTSTSRAAATLVSGASTFLNTSTPPGAAYGSSRNQPYINLRPAADNATSPSITTYTFDRPTPASGWMFTLGDIDADRVVVSATAPDGSPVPTAALGFRGVFNFCGGTPSPCARANPPDLPTWSAATASLTSESATADTTGASGWFEPTTALATLTFTFYQRSGFPVYQTWFADRAHDVTGTISGCATAGVTVDLLDDRGTVVATTRTADDGSYGFAGYVATTYDVRATSPAGCEAAPPEPVDITEGDATADIVVPSAAPTQTVTATETTTQTATQTVSATAIATQTATVTSSSGETATQTATPTVGATVTTTTTPAAVAPTSGLEPAAAVPTSVTSGLPATTRPGRRHRGWLALTSLAASAAGLGLLRRAGRRRISRRR